MPDKIKLVLRVEGLKQLAEEMAVGGYFSESHGASEEELPEMEQRVLDDGGIELTMPLKLKSIGGHRNVIVPEGNGMAWRSGRTPSSARFTTPGSGRTCWLRGRRPT